MPLVRRKEGAMPWFDNGHISVISDRFRTFIGHLRPLLDEKFPQGSQKSGEEGNA